MKKMFLFLLCLAFFLSTLYGCTETDVPDTESYPLSEYADMAQIEDGYVQTVEGFSYLVEGYTDDNYTVGESLFADFSLDGKFNRYTIAYLASAPVKAVVSYRSAWGVQKSETVYLESGRKTFCSLLDGFLKNKYAIRMTGVTFYPFLSGTRFLLLNAETELDDVPSETVTLEGTRFIIGITLKQGGGMSSLLDKQGSILYGNLLNNYDTGRLVQQSYYGTTGNEEYTPGYFNGTDWRYNPVQGGDQHQNESKIIDYVVGENYIYIKCQPLDWSSDGFYTPSYMENTYTVTDDKISVSCRFVDFSGWEHPLCSQELPAFYTVSALDTFTYYQGDDPWTSDALTTCADLPFWGDPIYAESCRFAVDGETWCAWTGADGYGIGLYTPGVDTLYAGRAGNGHSTDEKDASCSYVAPLASVRLQFAQPLEYTFLISCGSVEEIGNIFYACHSEYNNNF